MRIKNPKYVEEFRDRFGKRRFYFRRAKEGPRIALPIVPDDVAYCWHSPEFMQAYAEALKGNTAMTGSHHIVVGSVESAMVRYYQSAFWLNDISDLSRDFRKPILEHFRKQYGALKLKALQRSHVQDIISRDKDGKPRGPGAQRNWLKALRGFCKFAQAENLISVNPTDGVIKSKLEDNGGIRPWTEADVKTYQAKFALGTISRLAVEMMLNLGVRVSDAAQIGPTDIKGNVLTDYVPQKLRGRGGHAINVPVHPELRKAIAATPHGIKSYLVTTEGKAYTAQYLSQKVSDWCREAGLPDCSSHGLRKLCLTRLADAGCTPWDIMAISGHKTLAEVQRYTEAANRKKLAFHAVAKLRGIVLKGNTAAELAEELEAYLGGEAPKLSESSLGID